MYLHLLHELNTLYPIHEHMLSLADLEYLIPYSWTYEKRLHELLIGYLIPHTWKRLHKLNTLYPIHDGWASRSKFSKRARGLLPTWLHFTNSIRSLMTFVSSRVTLPVDLINRNWTPPSWECVWSIAIERLHELHADQLINWSIDQLRLLDLLTNWSIDFDSLDQLHQLRLLGSTSLTN